MNEDFTINAGWLAVRITVFIFGVMGIAFGGALLWSISGV